MNRPHPRLWLRNHPLQADVLLAVLVGVTSVGSMWSARVTAGARHPNALFTALVLVAAASIIVRRRSPLLVLAVASVADATVTLLHVAGAGGGAVMIAIYSVATLTNGPVRTMTARVFAVSAVAVLSTSLAIHTISIGDFVSTVIAFVGAYVLGDNLQRRRVNNAALAERAEQAERERELISRQRVQDERSRIARELHDVVAHSVSLMIIQAGAARRSIASSPLQAEAALKQLETTGRQAMDELRRVLGVLREQDDELSELAPQPSLTTVRSLVESDPSLPVELCETGEPPVDVPSSVGLSLYRVVQEALTNVRKHAGSVRSVNVNVNYEPDKVVVQILDDGRGASVPTNVDGHGLVGMRERMALCGGTVTAGPRPGGGWQVRATAPLVAAS